MFFLVNKDEKDKAEEEFNEGDYSTTEYDMNETSPSPSVKTQTSAAARDEQIDAYEALVNKYIAAINKVINGDMDAYDEYNSLKSQVKDFETNKGYKGFSQAQHIRINRISQRYKDRLKELGGI